MNKPIELMIKQEGLDIKVYDRHSGREIENVRHARIEYNPENLPTIYIEITPKKSLFYLNNL